MNRAVRMCVYVCVCMYVCVRMCVYVCVCTYVCVRKCVYVCMCTYVCMYVCVRTCARCQVREAAEVHRQVRAYAKRVIKPGMSMVDIAQ